MATLLKFVHPKIIPALDDAFQPAALANRMFREAVAPVGVPLVIGLERNNNEISRYATTVFPEGHPDFELNFQYIERIVKFLLWQRGGFKVYIGGPRNAEALRDGAELVEWRADARRDRLSFAEREWRPGHDRPLDLCAHIARIVPRVGDAAEESAPSGTPHRRADFRESRE